jgi:2-iminobutanoate/2-iminopropanoate deaminase
MSGFRFIHISGQVATNDTGDVAHAGDFRGQCLMTLERLAARLEQTGSRTTDLVKITVFLTDLRYLPILVDVLEQERASARPACSVVQVAGLVHPDLMIEVEGFAISETAE